MMCFGDYFHMSILGIPFQSLKIVKVYHGLRNPEWNSLDRREFCPGENASFLIERQPTLAKDS